MFFSIIMPIFAATMLRLIYILLLCLLTGTAVGQPRCTVTRYDEQSGLPSSHITQLLQDDQGFMWFATWNGLCRFDGYEFQTFKPKAGDGCHMTTDRIRNISLMPDGNILCRVDEEDFLFDLHSYRFLDIDSTKLQFTDSQLMKLRQSRSLQNRESYTWTDHHQTTWTISSDGMLTYQEKGSTVTVHYPLSCSFNTLTFVMADRDGNLWALDYNSIYRFSTDISRAQRLDITPKEEVKCLFADSQGHYWVTTKEDAAVRQYDAASNRLLGFLDTDGQLHQQHISFAAPVYCMYEAADGTLWLGTKRGGLFRLQWQEGRYKIAHFTDIPHQDVYHIAADRYGRLWVAMLGGGVCYSEAPSAREPHFVVPKHYPQQQCPRVRYLLLTDSLWMAATGSGLLISPMERRADKMTFRLHQRETERANSMSSSATMDVVRDSQHRYYVSTESGGVNMIEDGDLLRDKLTFRHLNDTLHVQHTDIIQSLTPLRDGGLMAIGSHLLTLIDRNLHSRVLDVSFLDSDYRFSEAHPLPLKDNRWLIGLTDGAIITDMRQLSAISPAPTIALTGLSIQGGATLWDITRKDTLVLQPDRRSITIRFAALDYKASERISYAFRVLPAEEWHYIGHDRLATLLDMEPGTYRLEVRSTNADGEWQDNIRLLTIVVTPTFWEAWYGQLLILLMIVTAVLAVVYTLLYIRRIKRKQRETLQAYLALIEHSMKEESEKRKEESGERSEEDPMMKRLVGYIEEHLSDSDISVGDMAEAVATSRSGLQRKIKQAMGITPQDFLREARIKHACHLLRTTEKNISEIAYASGFTDPKYFSRCFKQSTGKTPSEWKSAL